MPTGKVGGKTNPAARAQVRVSSLHPPTQPTHPPPHPRPTPRPQSHPRPVHSTSLWPSFPPTTKQQQQQHPTKKDPPRLASPRRGLRRRAPQRGPSKVGNHPPTHPPTKKTPHPPTYPPTHPPTQARCLSNGYRPRPTECRGGKSTRGGGPIDTRDCIRTGNSGRLRW